MLIIRAIAAALLTVAALPAQAENFPSRAIKLIVPYAAGGTGDIVARAVADRLAIALGQSVVVENRAGATGAIGTQSVAAAAPDGYTLLVGQTGEIAINPHWSKNIGYDPDKDLVPVALATVVPLALVVPGKASYGTMAEMLKVARERGLSFASAGTATPGHFAGEVLKFKTQSRLTHVPYKGAAPALNDLLGGHVDLFFSGFPAALPHVKAGNLKLIAVSSGRRSGIAPDVPTVAEAAAIPGYDISLWQGFFAPRDTPKEIVERLNREINKILGESDVKQRLLEAGADVTPVSVDQFATFVTAEIGKFQQIIRETGLTP
ncbi:MAG TPA: tripartite tricarboxylate transporter substrate binding protein [Xanthobacteraceae bacterium]|nr:tripartite tricarboxylate transporter substrate binding protein [Xanthobacteraceae bacterium]